MHKDFLFKLELLLKQFPSSRPFICKGDPYACKVFIVGFNPATELNRPFLEDWSTTAGFEWDSWFENYKKERQQSNKNGKKRREVSNTRQRLNWLSEVLRPIKCLETNLYTKPTKKAKELRTQDQDIEIFKFLVTELRPEMLVLHGMDVIRDFEKNFSVTLEIDKFNKYVLFGKKTTIVSKRHFSRGWSKVKIESFAKEIKHNL